MQVIVAERIKELMKEENLNQVRLAEKIGVKQNTISAWLSGKKEPCITSLWKLADFSTFPSTTLSEERIFKTI